MTSTHYRQDLKGLLGDMVMRLVSAVRTVDELRKLPADSFFVTVNGKVVEWQQLDAGVSFEVHIRLRGGKGAARCGGVSAHHAWSWVQAADLGESYFFPNCTATEAAESRSKILQSPKIALIDYAF
ncbi:unnamed protein product [Toxocara canis]|uniref:DUF3883 domain-containing protein n=1 Tax=Toxocara canis TaxID=6265 RepID=A0A183VCY3_TOXCA|nr:unnamed protein product [Toxocara canis]